MYRSLALLTVVLSAQPSLAAFDIKQTVLIPPGKSSGFDSLHFSNDGSKAFVSSIAYDQPLDPRGVINGPYVGTITGSLIDLESGAVQTSMFQLPPKALQEKSMISNDFSRLVVFGSYETGAGIRSRFIKAFPFDKNVNISDVRTVNANSKGVTTPSLLFEQLTGDGHAVSVAKNQVGGADRGGYLTTFNSIKNGEQQFSIVTPNWPKLYFSRSQTSTIFAARDLSSENFTIYDWKAREPIYSFTSASNRSSSFPFEDVICPTGEKVVWIENSSSNPKATDSSVLQIFDVATRTIQSRTIRVGNPKFTISPDCKRVWFHEAGHDHFLNLDNPTDIITDSDAAHPDYVFRGFIGDSNLILISKGRGYVLRDLRKNVDKELPETPSTFLTTKNVYYSTVGKVLVMVGEETKDSTSLYFYDTYNGDSSKLTIPQKINEASFSKDGLKFFVSTRPFKQPNTGSLIIFDLEKILL